MENHYGVVIIGTGPAGLSLAYSLLQNKKPPNILMIDAGVLRKSDKCFMEQDMKLFHENPEKCKSEPQLNKGCKYAEKCGVCSSIAGFGGCLSPNVAAKLCFPPSGKRLPKVLGEENVYSLAKEVWNFYSKFAEIDLPYPVNDTGCAEKKRISEIVETCGVRFFEHPIHVASENEFNTFLRNVHAFLEKRVDILLRSDVDLLNDVDITNNALKLGGSSITYDKLILATGRFGFKDMKDFLESIDSLSEKENISFGLRIMLPNKYLYPIGKYCPDFKIKYEDDIAKYETFCFNGGVKGGRLKYMNYGSFVNVDGFVSVDFEGDKIGGIDYGNFAILTESKVAEVTYNNGRPQDCLSLAKMPMLKTFEFSEKVHNILAKINNVSVQEVGKHSLFSTMVYENVWGRIKTDNSFWVRPNVAVIGDASGIAMGIISSMIMGAHIANEIKGV